MVTFDLFSALIDSRTGASRILDALAQDAGWPIGGEQVYDDWDRRNKSLQQATARWVPFAEHCRSAMTGTYASLGLSGDPRDDADRLMMTVGEWPLWPDVPGGVALLREHAQIGVLSNVDDAIYARTRVAQLGLPRANVLTSERLQAYKPAAEMYRRAVELRADLRLHVASSARDVRGALEAGLPMVRLARPGHVVDPAGPQPTAEVFELAAVAEDPRLGTSSR